MRNKVKILLLSTAFCFFSYGAFAQTPPEPMANDTTVGHVDDCGTQGGLPPVGLCMPINDYLVPLLISGIFLGAYKLHNIEKATV